MPEESIENMAASDNTFAPTLIETRALSMAKFIGNCFIRNNVYNLSKHRFYIK